MVWWCSVTLTFPLGQYFSIFSSLQNPKNSNFRHTSFYCALLYCTSDTVGFFYKMKVCGKPVSKSISAISPTFAPFLSHILGILVIFQTPLLLPLWTVISDFWETVSQPMQPTSLSYFKKLPQPPQPQQPPPYSVSSHQHWAKTPSLAPTSKKIMAHWRLRWQHFLAKCIFKLRYIDF